MISKLSFFLVITDLILDQTFCVLDLFDWRSKEEEPKPEPLHTIVPMIDGAIKTDRELPRGARSELLKLIAEGGTYRYEAYKTGRTAGEVESFYNDGIMTAAGWRPVGPRLGDGQRAGLGKGGFCLYDRTNIPSRMCLAMYAAEDLREEETYIFYMVIEAAEPRGKPGQLLNPNR